MKVNQRNVYINPDETDVRDVLRNIFQYMDISAMRIDQRIAEIFNEQGKVRISSPNIPSNVYKNPNKWEKAFESEVLSESIVSRMMTIISYQDLMSKKAMVVYMMTEGFHRYYDNFELITEFNNNPEWDYDDLRVKAEENTAINKLIKDECEYSDKIAKAALKEFFEWLKLNLSDEFYKWFMDSYGEEVTRVEKKFDIFSMKKTIVKHLNETHEDVDDALIAALSDQINLVRIKSRRFFKPTLNDLFPVFDIKEKPYREGRDNMIEYLVKVLGADLLKYALTKNEEEN